MKGKPYYIKSSIAGKILVRPKKKEAGASFLQDRWKKLLVYPNADLFIDDIADADVRILGSCLADKLGIDLKDTECDDLFGVEVGQPLISARVEILGRNLKDAIFNKMLKLSAQSPCP